MITLVYSSKQHLPKDMQHSAVYVYLYVLQTGAIQYLIGRSNVGKYSELTYYILTTGENVNKRTGNFGLLILFSFFKKTQLIFAESIETKANLKYIFSCFARTVISNSENSQFQASRKVQHFP